MHETATFSWAFTKWLPASLDAFTCNHTFNYIKDLWAEYYHWPHFIKEIKSWIYEVTVKIYSLSLLNYKFLGGNQLNMYHTFFFSYFYINLNLDISPGGMFCIFMLLKNYFNKYVLSAHYMLGIIEMLMIQQLKSVVTLTSIYVSIPLNYSSPKLSYFLLLIIYLNFN